MNEFDENKKNDISRKKAKLGSVGKQLFEIGKLQPQAIDLEEAVLGALMLDKDALMSVMDILSPESFYKEAHNWIFSTILGLFKIGTPVDILTVTQSLIAQGKLEVVGGAYYITQLTNRVASAANVEFHARIISQKYMQRELIRLSTGLIRDCYEDTSEVFSVLDQAMTGLTDILIKNVRSQGQDATVVIKDFMDFIEKASNHTEEITGINTGLTELDKLTNGWQNGDLIVIAARPGMGKSALTKAFVRGAIRKKKPVAVVSLEMTNRQVIGRLLSEDIGESSQALMMGKFEKEKTFAALHKAIAHYYNDQGLPLIHLDDSPSMNITELKAKAKRLKKKMDIGILIVDYLQLLDGGEDNEGRVNEIGKISRGLKQIAKDLNIPVIALAQLSRAVESQGGHMKPKLSHLRESGSIEQDADVVGFIWRPGYYIEQGVNTFDDYTYRDQPIEEGFTEIIIAKHRNGPLGVIAARFTGKLTKFSDWDAPPDDWTSGPPKEPPPDIGPTGPIIPANTNFFEEGKKNQDKKENPPNNITKEEFDDEPPF